MVVNIDNLSAGLAFWNRGRWGDNVFPNTNAFAKFMMRPFDLEWMCVNLANNFRFSGSHSAVDLQPECHNQSDNVLCYELRIL